MIPISINIYAAGILIEKIIWVVAKNIIKKRALKIFILSVFIIASFLVQQFFIFRFNKILKMKIVFYVILI